MTADWPEADWKATGRAEKKGQRGQVGCVCMGRGGRKGEDMIRKENASVPQPPATQQHGMIISDVERGRGREGGGGG